MARAVRFDEYGPVENLYVADDVDEPEPAEGRVVVRVVATGINPGEIMIREGGMAEQTPATFPSGQGSDLAGRIHALGAGVHGWSVGDDVFGWTDERAAQADFVSVPADQLSLKPPDVAWEQAGALYVAGGTAYATVEAVRPVDGETVVVAGAAGGVGSIAVQLLRSRGVRVIGIAGEDNADFLRGLGVEPVAHGAGLGHRLREAAPDGLDALIDCFGGGYVELAAGMGIDGPRIATIIDFEDAERFGAQVVFGYQTTSAAVLSELGDLIASGELTVPIAATFPLEQVREAYTQLAGRRTRGKIVLTTGG